MFPDSHKKGTLTPDPVSSFPSRGSRRVLCKMIVCEIHEGIVDVTFHVPPQRTDKPVQHRPSLGDLLSPRDCDTISPEPDRRKGRHGATSRMLGIDRAEEMSAPTQRYI
jgi:hypothetical protein